MATTGQPLATTNHTHKVLVVDDNEPTRDALLTLLRDEGFAAEGAEHGEAALRVLREGYDACLILLDLVMPVMNGWQFRTAQRRDAKLARIPVVLMTATADADEEAIRLGAVAGFRKPLDLTPLLDLVTEHCPSERA